jgi:ClpP class serine protease
MLGSIGVRAAFRRRGSDSTIDIVSSQSPKKVPDVETDAGKAQIRATLDALADVFIDDVARYRGVERDTVLEHFGQGDVVVGRAALEVGMADEIGTFEGTLAALARGELDRTSARPAIRPAARGDSAHATDEEGDMPDPTETPAAETPQPITTVEQLRAAYPALTQQIDSAASDQKAEAERARILGIADLPGDAAVKRACQEDPSCSVGAAAQKILAHQSESAKARARAELAVRAGDEGALDPPAPSSEGGGSDDDVAVQRLLAAARRTGIAVKSTPVHEA